MVQTFSDTVWKGKPKDLLLFRKFGCYIFYVFCLSFCRQIFEWAANLGALDLWSFLCKPNSKIVSFVFRDSTVAIVVYDVTNEESFNQTSKWIDDVRYRMARTREIRAQDLLLFQNLAANYFTFTSLHYAENFSKKQQIVGLHKRNENIP